jgi:hypothetical protein
MDASAIVTIVVPTMTALTGLISAIATLRTSRADLHKIDVQAQRTGISPTSDVTALAVRLALELATSRRGAQS